MMEDVNYNRGAVMVVCGGMDNVGEGEMRVRHHHHCCM
jgi:hypothetical protein